MKRSADWMGSWGLAAVAVAFALAQATLGPRRFDFGWDETVYLSQVTPHVPAAMFTAPRARGVTLLVAPVTALSTSVQAVRVYLIVMSAVGLMLAFRVWLKVIDPRVVLLAAGLFASMWPAQVYGNEVYPNFWIALLAVAAVGWAAQSGSDAPRAHWCAALCLCAITVLRPGDAGWLWLLLLLAPRWQKSWRSLRRAATLGLAAGLVPWIVEAQVRFGGVPQRIGKSSGVEGGLFPHLGFLYEARALNGPLLCRPCTHASQPLVADAWWLAIPILIACSLVLTRRSAAFKPIAFAAGSAGAMAAPYLFLVGYSAPRFLLPSYALAAIPAADALLRLGSRMVPGTVARAAMPAALAMLVLAFVVTQADVTSTITHGTEADRRNGYRAAAAAIRNLGITKPCLIAGDQAPPIAFEAGCASDGDTLQPANVNDPVHRALARHEPVVIVSATSAIRPTWAQHWNHSTVHLKASELALSWPDQTENLDCGLSQQGRNLMPMTADAGPTIGPC